MASIERTQISLRVPDDLLVDIDRVASALERDRSWVMLRAFKLFMAGEGSAILEEAGGLAELERGDSHDLDDVLAEAEALIAARATSRTRKAV